MPTVDLSEASVYHDAYASLAQHIYYGIERNTEVPNDCPEILIHYCYYAQQYKDKAVAKQIHEQLNLVNGEPLLIIGGGFGWAASQLQLLLPESEILVTDISPWIHSEKNNDDSVYMSQWLSHLTPSDKATWMERLVRPFCTWGEIINEDSLTPASVSRLASRVVGNEFAVTMSIDVVPWITDNEREALNQNLSSISNRVVHMVAGRTV